MQTTKTILFASLITAMISPSRGKLDMQCTAVQEPYTPAQTDRVFTNSQDYVIYYSDDNMPINLLQKITKGLSCLI